MEGSRGAPWRGFSPLWELSRPVALLCNCSNLVKNPCNSQDRIRHEVLICDRLIAETSNGVFIPPSSHKTKQKPANRNGRLLGSSFQRTSVLWWMGDSLKSMHKLRELVSTVCARAWVCVCVCAFVRMYKSLVHAGEDRDGEAELYRKNKIIRGETLLSAWVLMREKEKGKKEHCPQGQWDRTGRKM